jgi:hypothetical protein
MEGIINPEQLLDHRPIGRRRRRRRRRRKPELPLYSLQDEYDRRIETDHILA